MSLQGKVVVITGASAGIGRATAREMARRGAHVGLIARGAERLEAARREVEEHGVRACVAPADVADPEQVERAAAQIEAELGPIDVWVNNAMAAKLAPVVDTRPEEFRRVTEVTYLGSVYGTQAALRRMRSRNRGVIVQVGSALSRRGIPLQATYCGAKHALKGFLDSLRVELLHDKSKVRVALVQLPGLNTPQFGWVRTDLHRHPQPVPPIYQPEVAARAIAWAAEHPKRELWVGLPTVYTILGEKFASGLMDRYLARTNIEAQQTDTPIAPAHRDDNLQSPPPGDPGAHGRFDGTAKARSPQLWLATHKRALAGAAAGAAALGTTAIMGARR
jgi:NAD(P)-dependent dehydrogenase (short-subunit alcohol dehydrogenase family)